MRNLENKIAIVTGAGSGIGKATALLLAHEGAKVIVSDIDEKNGICQRLKLVAMGEMLFL